MTHSTIDFAIYPFVDSRVGYDHRAMYDLCRDHPDNPSVLALGQRPYLIGERGSCYLERLTVLSDQFKSQVCDPFKYLYVTICFIVPL